MTGEFDAVIDKVTAELKEVGFGILTDIDVKATLKKKIDVDFRPYRILGACNPPFAHQALLAEDKIGVMLPCNVIVQDHGNGNIEVSAMDPAAVMQGMNNPALEDMAIEVRQLLEKALQQL
jgi:uncharacterized protein (DUF302 family)